MLRNRNFNFFFQKKTVSLSCTVTHKIMYTVVNFFSVSLAVEKKGENLEKFIRIEQASEPKKINFAQCKIKNF